MSTTSLQPGIAIPLEWIDFDETPILFANHFLVQHQLEEFVVSMGQVVGPPTVGPPEELRHPPGAPLHDPTHVPINTLARVGLTRQRLTEFIELLQNALEEHDRRA
ncbi:MAG: hypothetical protein QOH83_1360 [Solirubrobacteraceae bacterium]|jgi:hypothetical protein|nr:hypothetical protein [Solirubrobacteraceae bacterium]